MALDLNKKIGPLSTRAWILAGAGTFAVVWYVQRRQKQATPQAPAPEGSEFLGEPAVVFQSDPAFTGVQPAFPSTIVEGDVGTAITQEQQLATLEKILDELQAPASAPTPVGIVSGPRKPIRVKIVDKVPPGKSKDKGPRRHRTTRRPR